MSKLAIYAGHGGSDPGACANGKRESDYTLKLMQEVTRRLQAAPCWSIRRTNRSRRTSGEKRNREIQSRATLNG